MLNRIDTSLECIHEENHTYDSARYGNYGSSPSANILSDKIKNKNNQSRRLLRNISEDTKNSARGLKTKRSEEKDQSLKRKTGNEMNQILKELVNLQSEYKTLRGSYNSLVKQKMEACQSTKSYEEEVKKLREENSKLRKEVDVSQSQISYLQGELERIKKESVKLLEVETYKLKKLEQNIKQREKKMASRNQSSLSLFHQQVALTEAKDYAHRIQPIYSHRNLYSGINTEIADQKIIFRRDHETVQCTIDQPSKLRRRNSSECSMLMDMRQNPNYSQTTKGQEKKKNPFQTINNNFKPSYEKKKRSMTGSKLNTGKKKPSNQKGAFTKGKKMNNQTLK